MRICRQWWERRGSELLEILNSISKSGGSSYFIINISNDEEEGRFLCFAKKEEILLINGDLSD